eukprot:PhM_4_TR16089/c1_g2_i1/m.38547/K10408/DNAH; dynein heavy chain, axonemal
MSQESCQHQVAILSDHGISVRGAELAGCSDPELPYLEELYVTYIDIVESLKACLDVPLTSCEFGPLTEKITTKLSALKSKQIKFKSFPTYAEFIKYCDKVNSNVQIVDQIKTARFQKHHWDAWQELLPSDGPVLGDECSGATLWPALDVARRDPQFLPTLLDKAQNESEARDKLAEIRSQYEKLVVECDEEGVPLLSPAGECIAILEDCISAMRGILASPVVSALHPEVEETMALFSTVHQCYRNLAESCRMMTALGSIMSNPSVGSAMPEAAAMYESASQLFKVMCAQNAGKKRFVDDMMGEDCVTFHTDMGELVTKLSECHAAVGNMLQTLREKVPRFHFLSDGDLLALTSAGNSGDAQGFAKILMTMLDEVVEIGTNESNQFDSMTGSTGYRLPLDDTVAPSGKPDAIARALLTSMERSLRRRMEETATMVNDTTLHRATAREMCEHLAGQTPQIALFGLLGAFSSVAQDSVGVSTHGDAAPAPTRQTLSELLPASNTRPQTAPQKKGENKIPTPAARLQNLTQQRCNSATTEPRPGSATTAAVRRRGSLKDKKGGSADKPSKAEKAKVAAAEAQAQARPRPLSARPTSARPMQPVIQSPMSTPARPQTQRSFTSLGRASATDFIKSVSDALVTLLHTSISTDQRKRLEALAVTQHELEGYWLREGQRCAESTDMAWQRFPRAFFTQNAFLSLLDTAVKYDYEFKGKSQSIIISDNIRSHWEQAVIAQKMRTHMLTHATASQGASDSVEQLAYLCGKHYHVLKECNITMNDIMSLIVGVATTGCWATLADLADLPRPHAASLASVSNELVSLRRAGETSFSANDTEWNFADSHGTIFATLDAARFNSIPDAITTSFHCTRMQNIDPVVAIGATLLAAGFRESTSLAHRIMVLLEGVSLQVPDFDVRSFLSHVLSGCRHAGSILRQDHTGIEEVVVAHALRFFVAPRLHGHQAAAFNDLLCVYFQNCSSEVSFVPMRNALASHAKASGLEVTIPWFDKTLHLFEVMRSNNVVAVVGEQPVGKSTAIDAVSKSYEKVFDTPTNVIRVCPTGLTVEDFEAYMDSVIGSWLVLDGVVSEAIVKAAVKSGKFSHVIMETGSVKDITPSLAASIAVVHYDRAVMPFEHCLRVVPSDVRPTFQRLADTHMSTIRAFLEVVNVGYSVTKDKAFSAIVKGLAQPIPELTSDIASRIFWMAVCWAYVGEATEITKQRWLCEVFDVVIPSDLRKDEAGIVINPFRCTISNTGHWVPVAPTTWSLGAMSEAARLRAMDSLLMTPTMTSIYTMASHLGDIPVMISGPAASGKTLFMYAFDKDALHIKTHASMKFSSFSALLGDVQATSVCVDDLDLADGAVAAAVLQAMDHQTWYLCEKRPMEVCPLKLQRIRATSSNPGAINSRLYNKFAVMSVGQTMSQEEISTALRMPITSIFQGIAGSETLAATIGTLLDSQSANTVSRFGRLLAQTHISSESIGLAVFHVMETLNLKLSNKAIERALATIGSDPRNSEADVLWGALVSMPFVQQSTVEEYVENFKEAHSIVKHHDFTRAAAKLSRFLSLPNAHIVLHGPPGVGRKTALQTVCHARSITILTPRSDEELSSLIKTNAIKASRGERFAIVISEHLAQQRSVQDFVEACINDGVPDDLYSPTERSALKADGDKFCRVHNNAFRTFQLVVRDYLHFVLVVSTPNALPQPLQDSMRHHGYEVHVPRLSSDAVISVAELRTGHFGDSCEAFVHCFEIASSVLEKHGEAITYPNLVDALECYKRRHLDLTHDLRDLLSTSHKTLQMLRKLRYEAQIALGQAPEMSYSAPSHLSLMSGSLTHQDYASEDMRILLHVTLGDEDAILEVPICSVYTAVGATEIFVITASHHGGACRAVVSENSTPRECLLWVSGVHPYEFRGKLVLTENHQLSFSGDLLDNGNIVGSFALVQVQSATPHVQWLRTGEPAVETAPLNLTTEEFNTAQQEAGRVAQVHTEAVKGLRNGAVEAGIIASLGFGSFKCTRHREINAELEKWSEVSPLHLPQARELLNETEVNYQKILNEQRGRYYLPCGYHWESIFVRWKTSSMLCLFDDPQGIALKWGMRIANSHANVFNAQHQANFGPVQAGSPIIVTGVDADNFEFVHRTLSLEECVARDDVFLFGIGPFGSDLASRLNVIDCSVDIDHVAEHMSETMFLADRPEIIDTLVDANNAINTAQENYDSLLASVDVWTPDDFSMCINTAGNAEVREKSIKAVEAFRALLNATSNDRKIREQYLKDRRIYDEVSLLGASLVMSAIDMAKVNARYVFDYSLFTRAFVAIGDTKPKATAETARMNELKERTAMLIGQLVMRGLASVDRIKYAFLSAMRLVVKQGEIDATECLHYLRGTCVVDAEAQKEWERQQVREIDVRYHEELLKYNAEIARRQAEEEARLLAATTTSKKSTRSTEDKVKKTKEKDPPAPTKDPVPFRYRPPYPFLSDEMWLGVLRLADTFRCFEKLPEAMHDREKSAKNPKEAKWREWLEESSSAKMPDIEKDLKLTSFQKLVLTSALRPDRRLTFALSYVNEALGNLLDPYAATDNLGCVEMLDMSDARHPLIIYMESGEDLTSLQFIEAAAANNNIELTQANVMPVSSQNHDSIIQFVRMARMRGLWAVVLNLEMASTEMLDQLKNALDNTIDDPNPSFRLIMTWNLSVPIRDPHCLIARSIRLQMCTPITIRSTMSKQYTALSGDIIRSFETPSWIQVVYSLHMISSILDCRKRFGMYGFRRGNDVQHMPQRTGQLLALCQSVLSSSKAGPGGARNPSVPWKLLRHLVARVHTSELSAEQDVQLTTALVDFWLHPDLCRAGMIWTKGYRAPDDESVQGQLQSIDAMPTVDYPEIFGLSGNFERWRSDNAIKDTFALARIALHADYWAVGPVDPEVARAALRVLDPINELKPWYTYIGSIDRAIGTNPSHVLNCVRSEVVAVARHAALVMRVLLDPNALDANARRDLSFGRVPEILHSNKPGVERPSLFPWLRLLVRRVLVLCRWAEEAHAPPMIDLSAFNAPDALLRALLLDVCLEEGVAAENYTFRYTIGYDPNVLQSEVGRVIFLSGFRTDTFAVTQETPHSITELPDHYQEYWRRRDAELPPVCASLVLKKESVDKAMAASNGMVGATPPGTPVKRSSIDTPTSPATPSTPTGLTSPSKLFSRSRATLLTATRRALKFRNGSVDCTAPKPLRVPVYRTRLSWDGVLCAEDDRVLCEVEITCQEEPNHWKIRGANMFLHVF